MPLNENEVEEHEDTKETGFFVFLYVIGFLIGVVIPCIVLLFINLFPSVEQGFCQITSIC